MRGANGVNLNCGKSLFVCSANAFSLGVETINGLMGNHQRPLMTPPLRLRWKRSRRFCHLGLHVFKEENCRNVGKIFVQQLRETSVTYWCPPSSPAPWRLRTEIAPVLPCPHIVAQQPDLTLYFSCGLKETPEGRSSSSSHSPTLCRLMDVCVGLHCERVRL